MKIYFVCTGNTCRSPMAHLLMEKYIEENHLNLEVDSFGLFPGGRHANEKTIEVLGEKGIRGESFLPQGMEDKEILKEDLILTMTEEQRDYIKSLGLSSVYTLKEYVGDEDKDIADPYGGNLFHYRKTYKEINESVQKLICMLLK